jgi:hypothetical protein
MSNVRTPRTDLLRLTHLGTELEPAKEDRGTDDEPLAPFHP